MDLKQLEYFVRVAELGSFTRASGVLGIAQPALSRQVRQLEVELRQNLLLRNGRGVTLTEAGKLLLDHGRGILHQVDRAREDLGRVHGALAGRVALGLPPSIARLLTVPLTRAFRKRLPAAALSISEGLTISMQEGLLTGRLDLALLYNPTPSPEFDSLPLMDDMLLLIGPNTGGPTPQSANAADPARKAKSGKLELQGETISLREVSTLPLVIPSRPNALRMLVEAEMGNIGCKPNVALEIDGVAAILDLVADGLGYAVLPRHALTSATRPEAYRARVIALGHGRAGDPERASPLLSRLVIATAAGRTTTLTQQAMIELIQQITAEVFTSGAPPTTSVAAPSSSLSSSSSSSSLSASSSPSPAS
ncbi:LysR substrate-binding domain-containing protein [Hylemonella gracilis]|uniref:LysR family transcriptional regulator n=1 Tax=Hylemonella gracilis ATCC 19624 TaxID=887062 RepID=F3KVL3_9BURK|nr:LysR substrate-binding domain-containing protein [Hylemonella gracilis]EGI76196.1 LysR family transcriptional regulator [Hylemonella gracilis ATCC 19624]